MNSLTAEETRLIGAALQFTAFFARRAKNQEMSNELLQLANRLHFDSPLVVA